MSFIQVTENGKSITLNIDDDKLIVGEEVFELNSIYGVDKTDTKITIHLAQRQVVTEEAAAATTTNNTTLLNIRPGDILWQRRRLCFELSDKNSDAFIEELKVPSAVHDKKVVVFINPSAGTQKANTFYKEVVKPMLLAAGIRDDNIEQIFTERDGKTRTLAENLGKQLKQHKQTENTIIICMGGDGTLHEVVNGLADANIGSKEEENTTYRVGVVPVGSGNAFSLSLNIESVEHALLKIIRGTTSSFHMMHVKLGQSTHQDDWQNHIEFKEDSKPIRLLVVMSWGFHAQIVSKARYLRYFMGNIRFSLVARFLLYFLKQYKGDLLIKNSTRYDPVTDSFTAPHDLKLSSEEKPFTYFIASKQDSLEKGFKISPFASPLSPDMDLVILRGATADALMNASIQAFLGGNHVKDPTVEYYKTSSDFLLRVDEKAELCLDGEICDLPAKGIVQLSMIGPSNEPTFLTFV